MAEKIELEIVTPKGRALSVTADEVTAPSVKGEFGVLPGHVPVVAALCTGIVTYRQGSETKRVAIGPGFGEAGQNKLLILAEEFAERSQIDPVVVRKELAEVDQQIDKVLASVESSPERELEKKALIDRENWLATQLELYGDPPAPIIRPLDETPVDDADAQGETDADGEAAS